MGSCSGVLVDQAAGAEHRNRAAPLSSTAIFTGQFISPLLFGPLIDATSTTTGFLVAAGVSAAILAIVVARRVGVHPTDDTVTSANAAPVNDPERKDRRS